MASVHEGKGIHIYSDGGRIPSSVCVRENSSSHHRELRRGDGQRRSLTTPETITEQSTVGSEGTRSGNHHLLRGLDCQGPGLPRPGRTGVDLTTSGQRYIPCGNVDGTGQRGR